MKKTLLSIFMALGGLMATNAQTITSQDFNSLTIGNVGTDVSATNPGQGGFLTLVQGGGGANSNFKIVNNGAPQANVLQITGAANATSDRYIGTDETATAWPARTAGNDFIEVEFDFNPGAATTSKNTFGIYIFNSDFSQIIGGFMVNMDTKIVTGVYNNNPQLLGILTANTWVRMGLSFNKTTGQVRWKGPGFNTTAVGLAGVNPFEIDFNVAPGTGNTVSSISLVDNFTIKATNTDTLGVSSNELTASKIAVYPNPVTDVLTISSNGMVQMNTVSMIDINGGTVKSVNLNTTVESQINISDLNAGIYFMKIDTNEGSLTKKVIKN
ncbi:MAG: T9SS type A sorting domain-containing protein [Flavobacterium sp.]